MKGSIPGEMHAAGDPGEPRLRSPGYVLRPLRPEDLEGISCIHWRACRIAYRFMGWSYSLGEVQRWYAEKLKEWDWGQAACAGETVVGFTAAIGPHLDQLFVDPDHQRAGVGSGLLRAMLERRLGPVTLHVFADNHPARDFFEKFGFREASAWWDEQDSARALSYRRD